MHKRKTRRTPESPEFSLSVKQKDRKVLDYICDEFGFGTVYLQKDGYYRLVFQRQEMLLSLIALFDGNTQLVFEEYKFEKWACCFFDSLNNSKSKFRLKLANSKLSVPLARIFVRYYISKFFFERQIFPKNMESFQLVRTHLPVAIDFNSAWLSGFMQAEGSFSSLLFIYEKTPGYFSYAIVLRISFRQNESYSFFQLLKKQFGGSLRLEGKSWKLTLSSKKQLIFFMIIFFFYVFL